MKNFFKSLFYFNRTEKIGITSLLSIIILLLISLFIFNYFTHNTPIPIQQDAALAASWNNFREKHLENNTHFSEDFVETTNHINIQHLFNFDPNTLDSLGFIRLGLSPRTTYYLLNWRRKGKVFYEKKDLQKLYTLTKEDYDKLAPYIQIASQKSKYKNFNHQFGKNRYPSAPDKININTTNEEILQRLRGIGPYFSKKIIEKRNALGGYINHQQLKEAAKIPDTIFAMLRKRLIIDKTQIKKINLNTVTEEQLKQHPYISETMAKNIILYKNALKGYKKIEEIRQVPLMNEEIYRKIAPYLIVE